MVVDAEVHRAVAAAAAPVAEAALAAVTAAAEEAEAAATAAAGVDEAAAMAGAEAGAAGAVEETAVEEGTLPRGVWFVRGKSLLAASTRSAFTPPSLFFSSSSH